MLLLFMFCEQNNNNNNNNIYHCINRTCKVGEFGSEFIKEYKSIFYNIHNEQDIIDTFVKKMRFNNYILLIISCVISCLITYLIIFFLKIIMFEKIMMIIIIIYITWVFYFLFYQIINWFIKIPNIVEISIINTIRSYIINIFLIISILILIFILIFTSCISSIFKDFKENKDKINNDKTVLNFVLTSCFVVFEELVIQNFNLPDINSFKSYTFQPDYDIYDLIKKNIYPYINKSFTTPVSLIKNVTIGSLNTNNEIKNTIYIFYIFFTISIRPFKFITHNGMNCFNFFVMY